MNYEHTDFKVSGRECYFGDSNLWITGSGCSFTINLHDKDVVEAMCIALESTEKEIKVGVEGYTFSKGGIPEGYNFEISSGGLWFCLSDTGEVFKDFASWIRRESSIMDRDD